LEEKLTRSLEKHLILLYTLIADKGKPAERRGRKATNLKPGTKPYPVTMDVGMKLG